MRILLVEDERFADRMTAKGLRLARGSSVF
jgi:hypothetical protein